MIKSVFGDSVLKYVNSEYSTAEYNPNTYTLFTELATLRILNKNGSFALIIPNTWLDGKYVAKMRRLLESLSIHHITNLKNEAFGEIVETVILNDKNGTQRIKPELKRFQQNEFVEYEATYQSGINPFNSIM